MKSEQPNPPPEIKESINKELKELYVVGVGASAGGLDALSRFLSSFNGVTAEFCVVVVMHLSPDYKSELTSILTKRCKWPVKTVEDNLKMEARTIYVTPQNSNLHIEKDTLKLDQLPSVYQSAPSVNKFLSSIAESKENKSIGIILSGFGSDGTEGMALIKKNNGLTIAQSPDTAEHNSMPSSAIDANCVDIVLPPEQMFDEIKRYCENSQFIASNPPKKKSIEAIFQLLEKRSGTDFSLYKPATIMRRIHRRMDNLRVKSLVDYYEKIKESPRELDLLFDTVLIGVTEFFRDKEAYGTLKRNLQAMLQEKQPGDSIRIWSVGCATGEEPYSICILLHELLGRDASRYHIQIFASDIDDRALNIGRKGQYPKESLENVSLSIKEKYFNKVNEDLLEINKGIKQFILFSKHDISNHPPFVKLDVISCRNLLIYFNNELQKQSFQIFHYALKPKGLLFLGKSESVGVAADLFEKADKNKIYRKAESSLGYDLRFTRFGRQKTAKEEATKTQSKNMNIVDVAKETLYHKYDDPFVIINSQAEIKEVHGSLRLYLEISQGSMNASLYKMANKELVTIIKALFAQVKKTGVQHTSHTARFSLYDAIHYVKIKIAPLLYTVGDIQYYLVIFHKIELDKKTIEIQKKLETIDFTDLRVKELEDELSATREHLQIFTEEIEATNEELQTINEELQSSNEELRSSNEELETSNEELQSANEELNTANNELRLTNEALIEKENELQEEKILSQKNENIYRSIAENIPNGAIAILNSKLNFEYIAGKGLLPINLSSDELIGKNILDLDKIHNDKNQLEKSFKKTLDGIAVEFEIAYSDKYYQIHTVPLNLKDNSDPKILYLAQDITEQKNRETKLNTAIKAADLLIYVWHAKSDVFENNEDLNKFLGFKKEAVITGPMFMEHIHDDDHAHLTEQWEKSQETGIINYEARVKQEKDYRWIRVFGEIIFNADGEADKVIATLIDITEDKRLLHEIEEREKRFRAIADSAPVFIWVTNEDAEFSYLNKPWFDYVGDSHTKQFSNGWLEATHKDDKKGAVQTFNTAIETKEKFTIECRLKSKEGSYCWFLIKGNPLMDINNNIKGFIGSAADINEQKEFTKKLEEMVDSRTRELNESNEQLVKVNMNLEEYAYVASHDLQEPIRKIRTFNSILKENIDNKDALEYSGKIEKSAERMTALIKNILDYSKLSDSTFNKEDINLNKVMDFIKHDLELLINERNARIKYKELGMVHGIELQLHQLFDNLIKNSIKFCEKKPVITIESSLIQGNKLGDLFNANPDNLYQFIKLTDNGIGINPEFKELIFKPFKSLNANNKYSGTGIGLAICKRIVNLHQGHIHIDEEFKNGTSFHIYLPTV